MGIEKVSYSFSPTSWITAGIHQRGGIAQFFDSASAIFSEFSS
jgi:hypothetical protein